MCICPQYFIIGIINKFLEARPYRTIDYIEWDTISLLMVHFQKTGENITHELMPIGSERFSKNEAFSSLLCLDLRALPEASVWKPDPPMMTLLRIEKWSLLRGSSPGLSWKNIIIVPLRWAVVFCHRPAWCDILPHDRSRNNEANQPCQPLTDTSEAMR